MKHTLAIAVTALTCTASAISKPPYDLYPYVADATDDPPINYMKVVEPGRTGEANASYVVLGISYPRTFQAVGCDYDGDLTVPAYVDGLPVRKVNAAGFLACTKLKSVRLPSTVREIGERAFSDCYSLTNVTFEGGVSAIGDGAFSNCVSLTSIRFPKTLSRLGAGCFQGCVALKDVYFDGNAPRLAAAGSDKSPLGEAIFRTTGYCERFRVHVNRGTSGWIAPYVKGVPEKWPVDYGYMQAHETVAEDGDGGAESEHGFVTVITEIKGSAVSVPESWADGFPAYRAKFGGDFPASLTRATGKTDGAGNALVVWQDYVAGTDPTDPSDRFSATISIVGGRPVVSVTPELSAPEKAKRRYTVWGKARLSDEAWTAVDLTRPTDCNFFKVSVEFSP